MLTETAVDGQGDRTLGVMLSGLGGIALLAGVILLVIESPIGLLVLMVGTAALVLGLDLWVLRAPDTQGGSSTDGAEET